MSAVIEVSRALYAIDAFCYTLLGLMILWVVLYIIYGDYK